MNALEINNLHKKYGDNHVLKWVSFDVKSWDFFALLWHNWAGKTTLISILTNLVNKTEWIVKINGIDIDEDFSEARKCIWVVPQEFNFDIFAKVIDIVTNQAGFYGIKRSIALQRAKKYLGELKLWDKQDDISRTLSGGMKRRLMIARALIHEPELLILDEPTAGVDIEIRRSMWKFLKNINANGTTIILTTHYLEEAENLCRNVAIIDEGMIIEDTRMGELLRQLKQETFVLNLENELTEDPNLKGFTYSMMGENVLEILVDEDHGINDLFELLNKENIKVSSLRNKSNRLEELFMRLVDSKKDISEERS